MEAGARTAGARTERRRRRPADATQDAQRDRDAIVIRLPRIHPALRDWLVEMMPGRALLEVLREPPEAVITHTRNARRERLLALRSFLDALIEESERPARRGRAREIEIE